MNKKCTWWFFRWAIHILTLSFTQTDTISGAFSKQIRAGVQRYTIYINIYRYIVVLMSYITGWFMLSIYPCSTGVLLQWHCGNRYDNPADCDVILEDISANCIYMFLGMYCIFCILLHNRVSSNVCVTRHHDDVIKWKHSPHKGQWRGAVMFYFICVWINDWVNNREASDFRRYRAHYDVIVMKKF